MARKMKTAGTNKNALTWALSILLNGSLLIIIAGYIFYEAFQRFINPHEVKGILMLSVACEGGLVCEI